LLCNLKVLHLSKIKQTTKMNFRIFKCKDKQEVLIFRDINDDGDLFSVQLRTFILPEEFWHGETVSFENEFAAKRFIKDFSQEAAQEFIDRFVA